MISYAPKGGRFNWLRSCLSYYLTVSFMHELNSDDNYKRMQFIALYILLVSVFCSVLFRFMFCIYTWRKEEIFWLKLQFHANHIYIHIYIICVCHCVFCEISMWNVLVAGEQQHDVFCITRHYLKRPKLPQLHTRSQNCFVNS